MEIRRGDCVTNGVITKVSGPLVVATGIGEADMFDVVRVGEERLIGEVIEIHGEKAFVQVYEETQGLAPGATVSVTGAPLSVELAPGLISRMYDGIQRPLEDMMKESGSNIRRGMELPAIDRQKKWHFVPKCEPGEMVEAGDILGTVQETQAVEHRILVPPGLSGEILSIKEGDFTVEEPVCRLRGEKGEQDIIMLQKWPVRKERPYLEKLSLEEPLVTGQRVLDTLFPLAKGGVGAIPGPFGSGKTVVQHQLAKWSDADIVIYIGCGERGNEMTDVLREFPEIIDPKTGASLMEKTVLIANTSDMPVAAREACIYTGITIAEYFRDMGYSVVLLADSTSRWAEALREMSGRLEEMPGEEGYPAYLGSRLAQFYERAGKVLCLGRGKRVGSISAVGAVSPPGGDISEPVSQATLRIVKVFWGLDSALAYRRHFPSVNWLNSYSLYVDRLGKWYEKEVSPKWMFLRKKAISILQQEAELQEIVKLVGIDALSPSDRLTLEVARSVREDYLQQNAFDETDTYTSLKKQFRLLELVLFFEEKAREALEQEVDIEALIGLSVRSEIARAKFIKERESEGAFASIRDNICRETEGLTEKEGTNG